MKNKTGSISTALPIRSPHLRLSFYHQLCVALHTPLHPHTRACPELLLQQNLSQTWIEFVMCKVASKLFLKLRTLYSGNFSYRHASEMQCYPAQRSSAMHRCALRRTFAIAAVQGPTRSRRIETSSPSQTLYDPATHDHKWFCTSGRNGPAHVRALAHTSGEQACKRS